MKSILTDIFLIILAIGLILFMLAISIRNIEKRRIQVDYHYQIGIKDDTILIYDQKRFVGRYITKWNTTLDSIIKNDNKK